MGRTQGSPGCHATGGDFEGMVGHLLQTNRVLLDVYLPGVCGERPLSVSVLENYLVYDWLAHNVGAKGLVDPRSFLVVLGPQIVTELVRSKLVHELAEICVEKLVENERTAVDDGGVVTQA
eukprot:1901898-Alexandrium_andersonii.AAC.1